MYPRHLHVPHLWLSLFRVATSLPCGGGGRRLCGCGVGGGRHVDDELGEDVRGEEVDADGGDAILDARLGAPLLRALARPTDRRLIWTPCANLTEDLGHGSHGD